MQQKNYVYEVTKEDTFDCAMRLISLGYNPVVLDFASGTNPGGGWRGNQQGSQEESLCRRSDLGLLLEKKKYPIPNDGLFYIKNVIINKNLKLENITPIKTSVIATELKSISSRSSIYLQNRINALYNTAIENNHDSIVLGAIGCGAFKESEFDATILSKEMRICADKYKDRILTVFAIFNNKNNYNAFVNTMKN